MTIPMGEASIFCAVMIDWIASLLTLCLGDVVAEARIIIETAVFTVRGGQSALPHSACPAAFTPRGGALLFFHLRAAISTMRLSSPSLGASEGRA